MGNPEESFRKNGHPSFTTKKISEQVLDQWLPALGIAGVILYFAFFLYRYALNIPIADDLIDVLQFLTNVKQSTDWRHAVEFFYVQHVDHRTLSSRLIYYLVLMVSGEINFRTLIFLANFAILLQLIMLYFAIRHHPRALYILLPVTLVLFQIRSYEISFWTMAGFAYMYVYTFAFASLSCLREVNLTRFLGALIFASLGTYTLASGQLIWLVGFASLLHQALIVRRIPLTYALWWLVCAALILIVWRIDYQGSITPAILLSVLKEPHLFIGYSLVLLGSAVSDSSVASAMCAGIFLLVIVGYTNVRRVTRKDISLELYACFIVLSVLAMSLGRSFFTDLDYALSSRYSFPSVLLLAVSIALIASALPATRGKLKAYAVITLLAVVYWVSSFQIYSVKLQGDLGYVVENYNSGLYWSLGTPFNETGAIVRNAAALGIYHPPPRPYAWRPIGSPSAATNMKTTE